MKKNNRAYIIFLRGVNVGGKNKMPMARLKECLEQLGFSRVTTYIASGNVILESDKRADAIRARIEETLPKWFKLDDELVRVLVLTLHQLQTVIADKPEGFGEQPEKHHSDVIFLMGIDTDRVIPLFRPREGVDRIWPGGGVIYSQRLSAQRTKSRLREIMATPEYKFMTIRNWNTTTKLLEMAEKMIHQ